MSVPPPSTPSVDDARLTRVFVHLAGYYPLSPEDNYRRFRREYDRFLKAWSLSGTFGPLTLEADWARWRIVTEGPGWRTEVEHILFRWEDIIDADRSRAWLARLGMGWLTFGDFIAGGALQRYFALAWRYAGFFLYPFVLMALIYAALYWLLKGALAAAGISLTFWPLGLVALAVTVPVIMLAGKALKLDHLLDDWIYGRGIVRNGDPAVERRLQALAEHLNRHEVEALVVGHSFGAIWGAELIARMVAARPEGPTIRFASVGASILKIGLHRAALPLRRAIAAVAASPRVSWCDYNALNDVMNFHRIDPVKALGLAGTSPRDVNVRFRPMVSPAYYRKMQRNFFRLHSQFISGNDNRAPYDYFMMMCGPLPIEALADEAGAPARYDDQGGIRPPTENAA